MRRDRCTSGNDTRSLALSRPERIHAAINTINVGNILSVRGLSFRIAWDLLITMECALGIVLKSNIRTRLETGFNLIEPDSRTAIGAIIPVFVEGVYSRDHVISDGRIACSRRIGFFTIEHNVSFGVLASFLTVTHLSLSNSINSR